MRTIQHVKALKRRLALEGQDPTFLGQARGFRPSRAREIGALVLGLAPLRGFLDGTSGISYPHATTSSIWIGRAVIAKKKNKKELMRVEQSMAAASAAFGCAQLLNAGLEERLGPATAEIRAGARRRGQGPARTVR